MLDEKNKSVKIMNTIDCIKTRRSRRLFQDKDVPDEIIKQILECGIAAPSSMDCQPWHFIITKDKEKLEKLAELKKQDGHNHILTAPVSIIVCVDLGKSPSRYVEDGVTAVQNMLLAIHEMGLGSVYLSASKLTEPEAAQKVRDIFSIPKNIMPVTILPLGYINSSETLDEKNLVDLDNAVHHDKW